MGAKLVTQAAFPVPNREMSETAIRNHQDLVTLTTKNGLSIPAVHILQPGAEYTLLFSHGNAEDVGLKLPYLTHLARTVNANVLAYEYAGYSIAEGSPSAPNCYRCIDAALRYLCSDSNDSSQQTPHKDQVAKIDRAMLQAFFKHLASLSETQAEKLGSNLQKIDRMMQYGPPPAFVATCDGDLINKLANKYEPKNERAPFSSVDNIQLPSHEVDKAEMASPSHEADKPLDVRAWFDHQLRKNNHDNHERSTGSVHEPTASPVPLHKIIIFGRSIGTGPSVDLASRLAGKGLGGLILMSPLESAIRTVMGRTRATFLHSLDIFCNYAKISKVDCPVLIIHGCDDRVVPCSNGEALYNKLQNPYPPMWVLGRGHNDLPDSECFARVRDFLSALAPLNTERVRDVDLAWQKRVSLDKEEARPIQQQMDDGTNLKFEWDYDESRGGMLGCTA